MTTSPTYSVYNPSVGVAYTAPAAYQVVPNSGTTVTTTVATYDSNGNLLTVSYITAYVVDVTDNVNTASYRANNVVKVTAASSTNTNGSRVFAPAGQAGSSCGRMDMWVDYTGHAYDQPPNTPTNLSPAASALVTTLTPTFQASFTDPTSGDTLKQYRIHVYNAPSGVTGALLWDSGVVNATASETANAQVSYTYNGPALAFGSEYSWIIEVVNQNGLYSGWSPFTVFSVVQGPNAPGFVNPFGQQTTTTPNLNFTYTSPAGTAMASYEYQIQAAGGTTIYDSGVVGQSVANNGNAFGTIPSGSGLQYGQSYTFLVWCKDTNGAQSPTASSSFSVASLPVATPTAPVGNATVNSQTPLLSWSYSDPSYPQAYSQVQTYNATTGALIEDTGLVANTTTTHTVGVSIAYGTSIRWRVATRDSAGLTGAFSAWAYAYVNNAPVATITSPANNSTVVTNTPTVTWTYTPSGGGYAQASATLTLYDVTGAIQQGTWTQSGTGTSYTLPAGVLQNSTSYQLALSVKDTNAETGNAPNVTFTLLYTPPADMQGQPLASGKNYLLNALLNTDNGTGNPNNWTQGNSGTPVSASYAIDAGVIQPSQLASGDGPVMGAEKIALSGANAGGQWAHLTQQVLCATAGWVPGSTRLCAAVAARLAATAGTPQVSILVEFWNGSTFLSNSRGGYQTDTAGAYVSLLGPQNVTIPASCTLVKFSLEVASSVSGDAGTAWFYGAQLEATAQYLATDPQLATDGGAGTASGWLSSVQSGVTAAFSIDPTISNPGTNGTGAQKIAVTADTAAAGYLAQCWQSVTLANTPWVAGSTSVVLSVLAAVTPTSGTPKATCYLQFYDASDTLISNWGGSISAATAFTVISVPATLIPANCASIRCFIEAISTNSGDTGTVWFMDAALMSAATLASSTTLIEGSLGTGFSYDSNSFSVRAELAGMLPSIAANPGMDGDPSGAAGGSISLTWDITLADATRFVGYLIERRRQDQASDDTAWVTLAFLTNKAAGGLTDFSAGGAVTYQYGIRQQIQYTDGSTGYSAHRAIVTGSCVFSPAWYLVNTEGTIYNFRLALVDPKRKLSWKEQAVYTQYLGRVGMARDAGPASGYSFSLSCYYLDSNGDDRHAIKVALVQAQQLNLVWSLKDPRGMVLPVYLGDLDFDDEDIGGDGLLTVTFTFQQAQDTSDY